jgi:hypothetical protein
VTLQPGQGAQHEEPGAANSPPAIIAMATGTKVLGASKRRSDGLVVNDCHAEVLARRACLTWLHAEARAACSHELQHCSNQEQEHQQQEGAQPCGSQILQYDRASHKLCLRPGVRLHMYISQPPCGDASILCGPSPTAATDCPLVTAVTPAPQQDASCSQDQYASDRTSPLPQADAGGLGACEVQGGGSQQQVALPTERVTKFRTGAKALKLVEAATGSRAQTHGGGGGGAEGTEGPPHPPVVQVLLPQAGDVEAGDQVLGAVRRKPGKVGQQLRGDNKTDVDT